MKITRTSRHGSARPIEIYDREYEWMLGCLRRMRGLRLATRLLFAEQIARFAGTFHTGRFADGALESLVLNVVKESKSQVTQRAPKQDSLLPSAVRTENRRRVLHVATQVMGVGGHTRTIDQWIKADPASCHQLVVTRQLSERFPEWLAETLGRNGGGLFQIPNDMPTIQRAVYLREIALRHADIVILHHFGHDLVPLLAFAEAGGPPVAVLNHADQMFWAGSSIADLIIDLRAVGQRISLERRFARRTTVLPIPIAETCANINRKSSRLALGIPEDQLVLVSVGRPQKFRPTKGRDFFKTLSSVLDRVRDAHLYVVGVDRTDVRSHAPIHPRVHLCGALQDPRQHQAAADLFLESFPWCSATALLEAAAMGTACVLQYAPFGQLLSINHELNHILTNAPDESTYIEDVCTLIADRTMREKLGASLRRHVEHMHTGVGWQQNLRNVYDQLMDLSHERAHVPETEPYYSLEDAILSEWSAESQRQLRDASSEMRGAFNVAFLAKQQGDYTGAFRVLWSDILYRGPEKLTIKALIKLPLHWAIKKWN